MNIKKQLESTDNKEMFFNDVNVNPSKIKVILINEIVPNNENDDFYVGTNSEYSKTILTLFEHADLKVNSTKELLNKGIYITNAVKTPKETTEIEKEKIVDSLVYLEKELALFPNCEVIMLMGDVARKAYNMIKKNQRGQIIIPNGSTYKLRKNAYFDGDCRVFPSYIITGKNILIEKSKFQMVTEDLVEMLKVIK